MKKIFLLVSILLLPIIFENVNAHTIDAIDNKYRIEIGWMNEPVVTGETNGIELYISELTSCPEISKSIKCAESQEFKNGIPDLEDTLKMQLVYKTDSTTLHLEPDHNIPGKYYAFVDPTVAGYYQANIIGKIHDTIVSLSMHPPKVDERAYIEFPESSDVTINQIINSHTGIIEDINELKESVDDLKQSNSQQNLSYAGMGISIAAIIVAGIAIAKSKK